jgi:hypothetical protein
MKKLSLIIALLCAVGFVSIGAPKVSLNVQSGHEYVDLGLSVKWATCNVGASAPLEYGNYYAWGEISCKDDYSNSSYTIYDKLPSDIGGNTKYDVAAAEWGSRWRMPSVSEWQELIDNCNWTWVNLNGYNGYLVTSKINGKSIFLPAAGWLESGADDKSEKYGNYWSATLSSDEELTAQGLGFYDTDVYTFVDNCCDGRTIRPVLEDAKHLSVDMGLSVDWATCNVGALTPWEVGTFFAWGEILPKTEYTEENSLTAGTDVASIQGNPAYDAARVGWGGNWRMPTKDEFIELKDNCDWTWVDNDGRKGYFVTSRVNGNTIVLPVTGYCEGSAISCGDTHGVYWSGTENAMDMENSYGLGFYLGDMYIFCDTRFSGICIRPVVD